MTGQRPGTPGAPEAPKAEQPAAAPVVYTHDGEVIKDPLAWGAAWKEQAERFKPAYDRERAAPPPQEKAQGEDQDLRAQFDRLQSQYDDLAREKRQARLEAAASAALSAAGVQDPGLVPAFVMELLAKTPIAPDAPITPELFAESAAQKQAWFETFTQERTVERTVERHVVVPTSALTPPPTAPPPQDYGNRADRATAASIAASVAREFKQG